MGTFVNGFRGLRTKPVSRTRAFRNRMLMLGLLTAFMSAAGVFAQTRIMPLGNSITEGVGSTDGSGYRLPLYNLLTNANVPFDFVGGLQYGNVLPDKDHEGHAGIKADDLQVTNYLSANPADVILLEIGTNDVSANESATQVRDDIEAILDFFYKRNKACKPKTVIGTSGTILNLALMIQAQNNQGPLGTLNNYKLKASDFFKIHKELAQKNPKDRLKMRGMDPQRNEIIVAGSAVFTGILKKWGSDSVVLCENALREGLVYDYLAKNRSKLEMESLVTDLRLRSILQLAKKCDYRESHATQVDKLALQLFDQTYFLHGLGPWEREILHYAALLHDIGYHISYKKHHKHTYYLIKNAVLNGFEAREIEMIANVARYHSSSLPKEKHENWDRLSQGDQGIAAKLASLLRLADGLDRSHFSVVNKLQCRIQKSRIHIFVYSSKDLELELWAAEKKKDFLEQR
ncbi:HD domain-containing protein, partial [candidate division KSB1 bacterium]|nr:HD domain-containing protein [candidate division KSB1 bacterium]